MAKVKSLDRKAAVKKLKSLVFTQKSETVSFRTQLDEAFDTVLVPNGVVVKQVEMGRTVCDYLLPEVFSIERVMIYVHGGSFVGGSRKSYRSFCASIANATSMCTYVPEIHLAPEHPFPSAIEDIISIINGIPDKEIIICADTSGASIALASVFSLSEEKKRRIKDIILFSPWLDLSIDAPVFTKKKAADEILNAESLRRCADVYTYRSNLTNPLVSPLFAGEKELAGMPPVYIQTGEKDMLAAQIVSFSHLLYENGIDCTVDVYPEMMPMFQMADEFLPDAHLAIEKIGKYVQRQ